MRSRGSFQHHTAFSPFLRQAIQESPLVRAKGLEHSQPVYAVVTNCTYDDMCYDAERVQSLLDESVDRIHFDEAWYAYARFNPMYTRRFAMRGDPSKHDKSMCENVLMVKLFVSVWQAPEVWTASCTCWRRLG